MIDTEFLYIVGVSAIGAASIAYIFFGPSPSHVKLPNYFKNVPIRGLKNVKNNCFINSILQSIASSDSMVTWLNYANITTKSNGKLILQISNIVNKINQNNDWSEILTPHEVLNALRQHRWVFSNEEQVNSLGIFYNLNCCYFKDAYELFNVLTSTLEKELKHFSFLYSIREILHVNDVSSNHIMKNNTISTRATGKTILAPHLNNTLPTRGILANHLICRHCGYKYPLHLDVFDSITLSLPANSFGPILLEKCLTKFVSSELIDDFMCESCSEKSTFDKKVEFIKLPKLLCFHVQRLVWLTGDRPFKRFDHVMFPEFLEMDPYTYKYHADPISCDLSVGVNGLIGGKSFFTESGEDTIFPSFQVSSVPEKPINTSNVSQNDNSSNESPSQILTKPKLVRYKYALNSVIVHLGNSSSGHFICYRRKYDGISNKIKWYCTSDLVVKEVNQTEVFSCSAYMLFYERIFDRLM